MLGFALLSTNLQNQLAQPAVLGLMYAEGRGVRKSRTKALKWFRKAVAQGHEYAMLMVEELER